MNRADFEQLADAVRNAAGNVTSYEHDTIGVTREQARHVIARFVDQLGEWLLETEAGRLGGPPRFHVDQFLDACGFPRPAEDRIMGGGYLQEAIELYRSGKNISEVADHFHMPRHIVLHEFRQAGVRFRGAPRGELWDELVSEDTSDWLKSSRSAVDVERMKQLYADGKSCKEISQLPDMPYRPVEIADLLRAAGVKLRTGRKPGAAWHGKRSNDTEEG